MANSAATLTYNNWPSGKTNTVAPSWQVVMGTVAVSAGNYVTNGLALTWKTSGFIPAGLSTTPAFVMFQTQAASGYVYTWDLVHNTIRVFESAGTAAPLAELTGGGATPAGVTGDTIQFLAFFTQKA